MAKLELKSLFTVDLRSLALFRIAVGFTVLLDLALRSRSLVAHYTDLGVLPAEHAMSVGGRGLVYSPFYWASHSPALEALLFAFAAAAAIALMLGYRTRIATLLAWFLLVSLQVRNPYISTAGYDKLLRILLFWGFFLPLAARFSLDARRTPAKPRVSDRYLDIPGAALMLQVALVYWVTGLKKTGVTWSEGSAVFYALHQDLYVTQFGLWLREFPELLRFGTHATRWLELLGPFLAFSPWHNARFRGAAIAFFAVFHFALALTLNIGLFPLVSVVGWLAFLPGAFWDALARARGRASNGAASGVPISGPAWTRWASGGAFIYVILFLGLQVAPVGGIRALPDAVVNLGMFARINQYWGMFAPEVPNTERWIVFEASLLGGEKIDVFSGAPPNLETPDPPLSSYLDHRWRLFISEIARRDRPVERIIYRETIRYLCGVWNSEHRGEDRALRVSALMVQDDADLGTHDHRLLDSISCLEPSPSDPRSSRVEPAPRAKGSRN